MACAVFCLSLLGCASGPHSRPLAWDPVPFPKNSDWPGPKGNPAEIANGTLVLQGQGVRTTKTYGAPVTVACDVKLESRTANDGSFDVCFLPPEEPLDAEAGRMICFRIIYSNTGEYGSVDRLEIDERDGDKRSVLWTKAASKVEAGKVCHLELQVTVAGRLAVSINRIVEQVPPTVTVPYPHFQIQLGGWQPTNRWHVRNFVVR